MDTLISKKICMLGSFSVGKTSLTRRFVDSVFSEKYRTTIGVKIDSKTVHSGNHSVKLIIWDLEGKDQFSDPNPSYLRGAAGYILVVDSTRPQTLQTTLELQQTVATQLGNKPFIVLLNKSDLTSEQTLKFDDLPHNIKLNWPVIETSAKTGKNVEFAFKKLTDMLLQSDLEQNQ